MVITLTDLYLQVGCVGHREVARVCDHDRNLIDPAGQGADLQSKLSILTYSMIRWRWKGRYMEKFKPGKSGNSSLADFILLHMHALPCSNEHKGSKRMLTSNTENHLWTETGVTISTYIYDTYICLSTCHPSSIFTSSYDDWVRWT